MSLTLPEPRTTGPMSLEAALAQRRSVRRLSGQPLSWEEISQLLWAAQGITGGRGLRTAPSAGALYPLEVYAVTGEGAFLYRPEGHRTEKVAGGDLRPALREAALDQGFVEDAPLVIVIAGDYSRTAGRYGDRAERYVHLEAGHAAQNVLLQAMALGLGAVPVGAFRDDQVREAIGLPEELMPLYIVPVGRAEG